MKTKTHAIVYNSAWMYAIDPTATGKAIRKNRILRGLSVDVVAEFFGISRNSVYKWERGETFPCIDNLYALAALLGVSLDALVVGNRGPLPTEDDDQSVELYTSIIVFGPVQNAQGHFCWIKIPSWWVWLGKCKTLKG